MNSRFLLLSAWGVVLCGFVSGCSCTDSSSTEEAENTEAVCHDGQDNDGDGAVDCADEQCAELPLCRAVRDDAGTSSGSDSGVPSGPDTGTDPGSDTGTGSEAGGESDTGADAGTGTDTGAGSEASADAGTDTDGTVPTDAGTDSGADTDASTGTDAASNPCEHACVGSEGECAVTYEGVVVAGDCDSAGYVCCSYGVVEVDADTPADGATDAGTDAATDPDTGSDAGSDAGADTGSDAGSDADADAGSDAGSDTGAETGTDAGCDRPCDGLCESCSVPGHEGICTPLEAGTLCREAAGNCDIEEQCNGTDGQCPADELEPATTECRGATGECDLPEACTGTSPTCPSDEKATSECRPAAGVCDVAEVCDGVADDCPADELLPAETACDSWNELTCASGNGCAGTVLARSVEQQCTGASVECDGEPIAAPWQQSESCAAAERCVTVGDGPSAEASCQPDSVCLDSCVAFVDGTNGSDGSSGWSWGQAKATIQAAIDVAVAGCEVWVRQGTYTDVVGGHVANLPSGVSLYGGFVGTETLRDGRSTDSSLTVLDGVSSGTVVLSTGDVVVDGITATGGVRGMSHSEGNLTVANCTFENNGESVGAGLYISSADSFIVVDSIIRNNTTQDGTGTTGQYAGYGAGMRVYLSTGSISRCLFVGNTTGHGGTGGGTYWGGNGGFGAGLFLDESTVSVDNSVFRDNVCGNGGTKGTSEHGGNGGFGGAIAGMYTNTAPRLTVTNSTFYGNRKGSGEFPGQGAAIYLAGNFSSVITNSLFWNNPGEDLVKGGVTQVTYCDMEGGYYGEGNIDQAPLLGDDLELLAGSPCIDAANDSVAPATDRLGHGRYDDPSIDPCDNEDDESCGWFADMGAHEYIPGLDDPCGGCRILSVCYAAGDINPANVCEICDPLTSTSTWTANDDAACDDSLFCNGTDTCQQGACTVHSGTPCPDDGLFCTGVESCDEKAEACLASGDPCEAGDCVEAQDTCDCEPRWPGDDCTRCLMFVDGDTGSDYHAEPDAGRSWALAFKTVQRSISRGAEQGCEVWVAASSTAYSAVTPWNISLVNHFALYGGFAGDEIYRDERDWVANKTVLTGGGQVIPVDCDGQYDCGIDTLIDGFTITNGKGTYGGGMYISDASPSVLNCTFSNGNARNGGGMYVSHGSPTVTGCAFLGNTSSQEGGGMYVYWSSPAVTNCTFSGNTGMHHGGGMYNRYSAPILTNSTFSGNTAKTSNTSSSYGGSIYNAGSSPTITNCVLWDHSQQTGGGIYNYDLTDAVSNPIVTYSDVEWGYSGTGNINADPSFETGSLRLQAGSPCVNAGNAAALPLDVMDLDGDGDFGEPIPYDFDNTARVKGGGLDMGAYEFGTAGG